MKKNRVGYTEKYMKKSLMSLAFSLAKVEFKIFNLVKLSETSESCNRLNKARFKRNCIRDVMFEKLKVWREDKIGYDDSELRYADIMELEKRNNNFVEELPLEED